MIAAALAIFGTIGAIALAAYIGHKIADIQWKAGEGLRKEKENARRQISRLYVEEKISQRVYHDLLKAVR